MNKNNILISIIGAFILGFITISSALAGTEYKVKSSDNLNRIINKYYKGSNLTRSQILVGILSVNPDAFKGGNINYLMSGKRLSLPDETDMPDISSEKANQILAEHDRYFNKGVTGNLKPPIAPGLKAANGTQIKTVNPDEQKTKIEALQKESEALRSRLEKLAAEKQASDKKLEEIEAALQKTLK